jgi:hypothetical protein
VKQPLKTLDVKMTASCFITLKLQDMCKINPFYIQKALDGVASKVRNTTVLKNGMLQVEVFNEKQAKFLGCYLVRVERHISLKSFRGVVMMHILCFILVEETQMCVAHQFISKVYRVIGKRDGKPFHLLTVF